MTLCDWHFASHSASESSSSSSLHSWATSSNRSWYARCMIGGMLALDIICCCICIGCGGLSDCGCGGGNRDPDPASFVCSACSCVRRSLELTGSGPTSLPCRMSASRLATRSSCAVFRLIASRNARILSSFLASIWRCATSVSSSSDKRCRNLASSCCFACVDAFSSASSELRMRS